MKHFYFLVFLALPFLTNAQSGKYQPGYVVTAAGDTIHGLINENQPERNPSFVSISSNNAQKQRFDIQTAQAFGVYGKFSYRRYHVSISQDKPGVTIEGGDTIPKIDDVFLKILISGDGISLLQYTDGIKTRFYTVEKNGAPTELVYHEYNDPDTRGTIEKDIYKQQLQKLAAIYHPNDQSLIDEIQTAGYKDYSLTKVIADINGPSHTISIAPPAQMGIRFFAGAGIRFITNKYSSDAQNDNLNGAANQNFVAPQADMGADIFFNREKQAFIFRVEVGISGDNINFTHNYNGGSTVTANRYTQKLSFNSVNVSVTPQIIFNIYNGNNFKFYADAGLSISNVYYSKKYYADIIYYSATNTTQVQDETSYLTPLRSIVFSVPVKLGVMINKRLDIYAAYSPATDLSQATGQVSIAESSIQAGINYLFGTP